MNSGMEVIYTDSFYVENKSNQLKLPLITFLNEMLQPELRLSSALSLQASIQLHVFNNNSSSFSDSVP